WQNIRVRVFELQENCRRPGLRRAAMGQRMKTGWRAWMAAAVLFAPLFDPLSGHAQDMPEPAPVLSETPEDSLRCMTLAIAYEAANQAVEGR
ncbi:hypothetical protein, partial [Pseudomonas aeruginosa]